LLLCGHVHDCWGQRGRIGKTQVVNLGPGVTWFEVER
jgi:Icc-related predicted phosphoesterase